MEKDLIEKIKRGDKIAFKSFYESYYESLAYYALKYVEDKETAEDVVQQLFLRIWSNRATLQIDVSLNGYMYRSVKNACLNVLKANSIRTAFRQNAATEVGENYISNQIDANDLAYLIESSILELPPERQKIFLLSREKGLKYKEIALELGISVKTVEAQMTKALSYFRIKLRDFLILIPWTWDLFS